MMEEWRIAEELERMEEWDPDAVCDALNIRSEELVGRFLDRAINWIRENCE